MPKRHETYPTPALTSQQYRQNATLSVYDVKGLAHGKNMAVIRSMSKLDHGVQKAHVGSSSRSVYTSPETHPAERAFNPVVTCRYPEQDWEDSEVFPPHLPMVRGYPSSTLLQRPLLINGIANSLLAVSLDATSSAFQEN